MHGVKGVLNEDMIDLGKESAAVLEGVANTPCAALRSIRMKPTEEDCARMLEVFEDRRPMREAQMCAIGCAPLLSVSLHSASLLSLASRPLFCSHLLSPLFSAE